jgi:D-alanine-D-alanine ligase-like ATP-grasp enzyme/ribosomal protein S18 acetylase RimI-like enzyme
VKPLQIVILHNAVAADDALSDRDVLVQVAAVEAACLEFGHRPRRLACTLNFELLEESLVRDRPDVVFNLVESLGESDRLAHLAAVLLEDLDIPYTGTQARSLHLSNNKPLTKQRLRAAGLPTPDWLAPPLSAEANLKPPYIIKAVWEHASIGLDDHAVVQSGDGTAVAAQIESRTRQLGCPCFAERFVSGREFNLSLLADQDGPQVLPPAEIDFSSFPKNKPQIVGYAAKWAEGTFEFDHTPRKFDFPKSDAPLLANLTGLAKRCWTLLELRGHVRVDFRVDPTGQPWILEVNTNPCLSPDAGYAAALAQAGIPFAQAVERILADALAPRTGVDAGVNRRGHAAPPLSPRGRGAGGEGETRGEGAAARATTVTLRTAPRDSDADDIRRIVAATGLFRAPETEVAVELVETRLAKGPASGYEFAFAEQNGQVVGYACFGKNTLTVSSFDLYWIAVEPRLHGQGVGRLLLAEVERQIATAGGTRIYIETSHRPDYVATRGFYERCGYTLATVLDDYYAPGDSKAVYLKAL